MEINVDWLIDWLIHTYVFCIQSMDAFCICIATSNEYILANYHTGVITDLFPYDADQTSPVVKRVGKVGMKKKKNCDLLDTF